MNRQTKELIRNSNVTREVFRILSWIFSRWSVKRKGGTRIINEGGLLYCCSIRIKGKNNTLVIKDFARVMHCKILINGDNNRVEIGENVYIEHGTLLSDFDNNTIMIGMNSIISRGLEAAAMEGTEITIGEECLFSSHISIRTCDSHSIIDEQGERINPSKSVKIGKHVWVGMNALFLKGAAVSNDSVVAARSVITKSFDTGNVVIAGQPARIVKCNVNWDNQLNPKEEGKEKHARDQG